MLLNIIFYIVVVNVNEASEHSPLRVYKGGPDLEKEFPFIVLFQLKKPPYSRKCTGSLISETLVLTAAHCLSPANVRANTVRYGDFTLPGNETKLYSEILKAFVPQVEVVDIGIALVQKISKPRAKLLAIDYKTLYGLPVKYAGFGRLKKSYKKVDYSKELYNLSSVPLQVGEGIIIPCPKSVNTMYVVCVVSRCSNRWHAPRQGDSGGPLVYNGSIIGVVSQGTIWPPSQQFAYISSYLEWIQGVMRFNGHNI